MSEPFRCQIPGWFSPEELARRRQSDPRAFDRGYRNLAITEGELWFPSFCACVRTGTARDHVADDWLKYTGVDLSGAKRKGNVIFTIAVQPKERIRIPVDIRRGAWSSTETAQQILDVNRAWKPQRIMVENNGYQDAILDWMRSSKMATADVPLQAWTTGGNKHADETGVRSIEAEFSQGHWQWWHPHDVHGLCPAPDGQCAWCLTYEEFRQAPLGLTNDGVMAGWFAREAVRKGESTVILGAAGGKMSDLGKLSGPQSGLFRR